MRKEKLRGAEIETVVRGQHLQVMTANLWNDADIDADAEIKPNHESNKDQTGNRRKRDIGWRRIATAGAYRTIVVGAAPNAKETHMRKTEQDKGDRKLSFILLLLFAVPKRAMKACSLAYFVYQQSLTRAQSGQRTQQTHKQHTQHTLICAHSLTQFSDASFHKRKYIRAKQHTHTHTQKRPKTEEQKAK